MTPKERVHAALARQPVDRVPVFLWFHPGTAERLARLLGIPASEVGAAMGDDVLLNALRAEVVLRLLSTYDLGQQQLGHGGHRPRA